MNSGVMGLNTNISPSRSILILVPDVKFNIFRNSLGITIWPIEFS